MQFIIIGIDTETIRRAKTRLTVIRMNSQLEQLKEAMRQTAKSIQGFFEYLADVVSLIDTEEKDEDDSPEERSTPKFCFFKVHLRQILPHRLPWYTSGFI